MFNNTLFTAAENPSLPAFKGFKNEMKLKLIPIFSRILKQILICDDKSM